MKSAEDRLPAYQHSWYKYLDDWARRSAEVIVPIVTELIRPASVVDVGCGLGTWLSVFGECGVGEFYGLDGSQVDPEWLRVPRDRFLACDLADPPKVGRTFDLAVSLEVAEHLPPEAADRFVEFLSELAPVVLFSAAIPFQGGEGHINEQWPDYWAKRFETRGYVVIDSIRTQVWENEEVAWWYAQNILLYARGGELEIRPALKDQADQTKRSQLALVHPRKYLELHKAQIAGLDSAEAIPPEAPVILADQEQLGAVITGARPRRPFLERGGRYFGLPSDSDQAIAELERMRDEGAQFLVFAWPAFWWLEFYSEFSLHLRSKYPLALDSERLLVFDLR